MEIDRRAQLLQLIEGAYDLERAPAREVRITVDPRNHELLEAHVRRADRIRRAIQEANCGIERYVDIIARVPLGVLLLDERGRLIQSSQVADETLRARQALCLKGSHLHAVRREDDHRLQRAIRQRAAEGEMLTLGRRGTQPLRIMVLPLDARAPIGPGRPSCVIFFYEVHSAATVPIETVRKALQLTNAEASLACAIFMGHSLREVAAARAISVHTCKSQLKSIYAKTGCRGRVELVRAVLMATRLATFPSPR
jgi:DNA-binding CsgD family transcriptional regulator